MADGKHKAVKMGVIMQDSTYDTLKFVAQILLPGLGALYFALAEIWGLPKAAEVVGTITAIDAFLGLFLRQSQKAWDNSEEKYDGQLSDETGLELKEPPGDKEEVLIEMTNPPNHEKEHP